MLDLKMIRTEPDKVKAAIQKREMNLDSVIDEILKIDVDRRAVTGKVEAKKAEQNAASKQIPAMKKAGQDTTELMAQMKVLSAEIKEYDAELGELEEKQKDLMLSLPNLPDEDVVAGGKEQNVPLHYFKEKPVFDFPMKNHVDLCEAHGMIECEGARLRGADVYLDFPSVGATENVMMAAVLARGRTTIHNAAREPEIRDLQDFINALGGKVRGGGTDRVAIEGVKSLGGARYRPLPDRIVAGTLLAAAAITHGEVLLERVIPGDLGAVLDKLRQAGCEVEAEGEAIFLRAGALRPFEISTQPFPGFPTDLQAQFMALACVAEGASVIVENVFENRFAHAAQLRRMGADIFLSGRLAVVRGGRLYGAEVQAGDLRGGAALALAALAAEGESRVENVELIDRGYERLEEMLAALGADIRRL